MSRRQIALTTVLLLGAAAVAAAETPTRLSVYVTAAPLAAEAAVAGYGPVPADDSAADAHLVVEVRSRRSTRVGIGLFSRFYGVLYAIKPGPKVAAARFAAMPSKRGRPAVSTSPSGSPEMIADIVNNGSWKAVGALIASKVDDLAEQHAAVLIEPATEAP
jgi:hypothetical protein